MSAGCSGLWRSPAQEPCRNSRVSGISGSRDAVREAVVRELLPAGTEDIWMAMIRSRNLTSHTYNPALAHEIAELIERSYAPALQGLQQELLARAQRR